MKKLARERVRRTSRPAASALLVLLAVTACGGATEADDETASTAQEPGAAAAPEGTGQAGPGGGAPGASGLVAALDGRTMQVQSDLSGQVAVTWTGSTTFTEQVEGTLADVTVGSCVMVSTDDESTTDESMSATSVRVVSTTGDCTMGFGGGLRGGEMLTDLPEGMPTDIPTDRPTDRPDGMAGGGGTFGSVTAVSTNGFTVESRVPAPEDAADADTGTTAVTVVVDRTTTYLVTVGAGADAVEVGSCVTASGEADDTGAITAATVAVSDAVDRTCASGLGLTGAPPAASDQS